MLLMNKERKYASRFVRWKVGEKKRPVSAQDFFSQ